MADPLRHEDPGGARNRESTSGIPHWMKVLGVVVAIVILLVVVMLLSGGLGGGHGPGRHS